jgi:hypothetical protein
MSMYRDEYLSALVACGFPQACDAYIATSAVSLDPCVADAMDKIAPTASQQRLATDLCAVCPLPGTTDCLKDFFFHGRRASDGSVTVSGAGASFDMLTERMVSDIRAACMPVSNGSNCWPAFYACVDAETSKAEPASVAQACAVNGAH